MTTTLEKCYACDAHIYTRASRVWTSDGQEQYVGHDCYRRIFRADAAGYQPPLGGPRLYCENPIPAPL
jgi:hypothetical protein